MTLFLDTDGVIAAFDDYVFDRFGIRLNAPGGVGDAAFWEIANAEPRFWTDLPVMEGAQDFFAAVRHLDPVILTGAPRSNFDHAATEKRLWWKRHFNYDRVHVVLSRDKHTYVTGANDVLVDDNKGLIKKWRKAGGVGILFASHAATIDELRGLGVLQ